MSDFVRVYSKMEVEAREAEEGEVIATLDGVITAGKDHIVVRVKGLETNLWSERVFDRDSFEREFAWEEGDKEQPEGMARDSDYWEWTVDELRGELSERGLATAGLKAELVERLELDDANG